MSTSYDFSGGGRRVMTHNKLIDFGLTRGMATLPHGNQELLVVKDKLEDPR